MTRAPLPRSASTRDDGRTRRGRVTRERLVDAAAGLVRARGFGATSVSDILAAAALPKGCFYHHFASKDALGLAVLERWTRELEGQLLDYLNADDGPPPLERLAAALDGFVTQQEESGCRGGSAFGNLVTELGDGHEAFRRPLAAAYARWTAAFALQLSRARDAGELRADADPETLAELLVATLEGGIVLARVQRDPAVLARVLRSAEAHVHGFRSGD